MIEFNTSNFGLFYDLINFLIIITFIFLIFKKNLINKSGFLILSLFSLTPILGNDVIWDFNVFIDQRKYIITTSIVRENYFTIIREIFEGNWMSVQNRFDIALFGAYQSIGYTSLLIASTPIPFIETARSLGFFSKFIFVVWLIYLIFHNRKLRKNEKNYYYYLLLLSPSLLIYTSVALKEAYIIVFFHLCMFSILYKKSFLFIISFALLGLLRIELMILIGIFSAVYIYVFYYFPKEKIPKSTQDLLKFLIVLSILIFSIISINDFSFIKEYFSFFVERVNGMKLGYHTEGDINSELRLYSYNFSIIPFIYDGYYAIMSPTFSKSTNIFLYLLIIENFLIISLFIFYFIVLAKLNFLKSIFYIILFLIFNLSVGILVINDMAIYRYKISMLIPLILIIREEVLNYKNENIIFNKS